MVLIQLTHCFVHSNITIMTLKMMTWIWLFANGFHYALGIPLPSSLSPHITMLKTVTQMHADVFCEHYVLHSLMPV